MIMVLQTMRRVHKIGKKLMILIICFSSMITLVATAIQLFMDYRQQRADVDVLLERVNVFLPPLAAGVWSYNDTQINLGLQALVNLPNITRAQITAGSGNSVWTAQAAAPSRAITHSYPLIHDVHGIPQEIAIIKIEAGLDEIYSRLMLQAFGLLLSNGIKTFLVAGFMYALFRHLVTQRVEDLAARVNTLAPQLAPESASFFSPEQDLPIRGDEIDDLQRAFDNLSQRLKLAMADLSARNQQLHAENMERRQAERSLQEAVSELSRTAVELERFAYVAAHDLQEPIRSVVSFSQMLERRCSDALGDDGKEYLKFIMTEAMRLSTLVADLLDYSRSEKRNLSTSPVDCREITNNVTAGLHSAIEAKHALLHVGFLPTLMADGVQIQQLFHNLIGNALKYSRNDAAPEIRIDAERGAGEWCFLISDNGIGIEDQYSEYIFEVFRRLHTRDAYPGTGIGLALCKRVIENHGGRIWVASTPGQGSTFYFTIPDRAETK